MKHAFVKYDANGIIIPGVVIVSHKRPSGEGWVEIPMTLCCSTVQVTVVTSKRRAFVKYTKGGRVIPGSLIVRKTKPKSGNWKEVPYDRCCVYNPPLIASPNPIAGEVGQEITVVLSKGNASKPITASETADPDVATVTEGPDGSIVVTLVGVGTTTITLYYGDESIEIEVTVTEEEENEEE